MGSEQFSQAVRGSDGTPVATSATGTIETDNYDRGVSIDEDGTTYPVAINPAFTVQVLWLTQVGDIEAEIHTNSGDVFTVPLSGGVGVVDWFEMDKVVFKDPNGTGAELTGAVGGD